MKNRVIACLCAILVFLVLVHYNAQDAFVSSVTSAIAETVEKTDSEPTIEDFSGEYTCTTISFDKDIVPLGEDPYTLTIDGDEAVVVGLDELGQEPLKLQFENGELFFVPPEEDVRIFTLRLLEDGVVTLTFDSIPLAPVFRFDPAMSGK